MYLIINLGLKSIRGIIFSTDGRQIYSKGFPVHTTLFKDQVEQDVDEWSVLLDNILSDIRDNTDLAGDITHISATTSSSCYFGADKEFKPLTKVLMVSDKRSEKEVNEIKVSEAFVNATQESQLTCTTSSLIPKALWFRNNKPKIFDKVTYWIGAGEFLNEFFTGMFFTDPLNASKSFYGEKGYNIALIEGLGIHKDTLPPVKQIGYSCQIQQNIIQEYNFSTDCSFVLTTYDAICAVIGSSSSESLNACDVSGTVTSVRMIYDKPVSDSNGILLSQKIDILDKYLVGSSNNLGGGIIEWCKQAFYDQNDSKVYFQMENSASEAKVGSNGMIFLPYLLGERSPFILPNASATFFGIKRNTTINDFTRAVFESTAYVTRDLVELIEQKIGINIKSITVSGGLARFDLINQIKADVCNRPVYVVDNFESTSIGAFILMSIANGQFNSLGEALNNSVKVRKIINPSEKNHAIYNEYFKLFKDINRSLTPLYESHKEIRKAYLGHENETVRNL